MFMKKTVEDGKSNASREVSFRESKLNREFPATSCDFVMQILSFQFRRSLTWKSISLLNFSILKTLHLEVKAMSKIQVRIGIENF